MDPIWGICFLSWWVVQLPTRDCWKGILQFNRWWLFVMISYLREPLWNWFLLGDTSRIKNHQHYFRIIHQLKDSDVIIIYDRCTYLSIVRRIFGPQKGHTQIFCCIFFAYFFQANPDLKPIILTFLRWIWAESHCWNKSWNIWKKFDFRFLKNMEWWPFVFLSKKQNGFEEYCRTSRFMISTLLQICDATSKKTIDHPSAKSEKWPCEDLT